MPYPEWLPAIIELNSFQGNWDNYLDHLYKVYVQDFIQSKPIFNGTALRVKRHPKENGKDATFWHIISEGEIESERTPDLRRCERISWPKPIIDNHNTCNLKIWKNQRKGETRISLWFEEAEYLIVLAERKDYILFWTAYTVTREHSKGKLQKEFESYNRV